MKDPLHAEIVSLLRKRIKPGMAGVALEEEAALAIERLEAHTDRLYEEIVGLRRKYDDWNETASSSGDKDA